MWKSLTIKHRQSYWWHSNSENLRKLLKGTESEESAIYPLGGILAKYSSLS